MSISTTAPATTAPEATAAVTVTPPRYPQIPARAGNANVRALLAAGVHPASGRPSTAIPDVDCGSCVLAYRIELPTPATASSRDRVADRSHDGVRDEHDGPGRETRVRLKCSKAPVSRRGRQGPDLRPATADQPGTPACTLHCTFIDWPFDPEGHDQTAADAIGSGRDHADDWGVYAVYRIFGIDPDTRQAWVELEAEMVPSPAALGGYARRLPQRSRPDQPHLYRFWTDLSRLHTAQLTHAADAGQCTHELVRNGRVLIDLPGR
ncbi:hypothetical protein [Streptomyces sp. NPDC005538]|uniref:hypothetical protein n=1 Tax=Streptomyces sp. NPDC005538 TaxID=3157043 RepID=UPI0033BDBAB3